MAGLTTLALLAVSAASTIANASNQRRAAGAAERQGDYEGDLLDRNAELSDMQAADARARGTQAELRQRGNMRRMAGSQRASMAAQGISLDSGSARDVVENDQALGELDALTIRNNAAREAWGYQVQSDDYRRQGDLSRRSGRETARSLRNQSITTLLTGAGELASLYATAPKRISRGGSVPKGSSSGASAGYQRSAKGYGGGRRY